MRVIYLYEADYNFILGVKWRQMLYDSDRADVLHRGQFDGRPACDALTSVFMEELKMRYHTLVGNLSLISTTILGPATTALFRHLQVLLDGNTGYIRM